MAIHKVLGYNVIRLTAKAFIRNSLDFKGKIEVTQIFKGNWRHSDLVLFSRNFDDRSILIRLIQILDANNLRDFTLSIDRKANGLKTLQLYLKEPFDGIVLSDWRNLNSYFNLSSLFLSNF